MESPLAEHITDERLAEIIKGCEGVTPGPWKIYDGCSWRRIGTLPSRDHYDGAVLAPCVASDGHPDLTSYAGDREANLAHIARLDPQTVLSLLTELQHRRAEEAGDDGEAEILAEQSAENMRLIDWISDKIGLPHDEELSEVNFSRWLSDLAASPSSPASGVRVKALEWQGNHGRGGGFCYTIGEPSMTNGWRVWVSADAGKMVQVGGVIVTTIAPSREDGIAAAQADFEARILSALGERP